MKAQLLDLSGFDDDEPLTIDERIHKSFQGVDVAGQVVVVTGYTKGIEGIMREFDRGYSEVTFSKVAVELRPAEAIIHKEFHLSSADPEIVGAKNTVVVGMTNYDVADQLADVGMEAIHPKAAKPMELAGIPSVSRTPSSPTTPARSSPRSTWARKARIEVIAGSPKVTAIEIHDPSMVGTVGFDAQVMEVFARHGVSYILKATNANSITQVVWDKSVTAGLHRGARERLRGGDGGPVGHGLRHRDQHRLPGRAGPRHPGAGRAAHQRERRLPVAPPDQHPVRHRARGLQAGGRGAERGALPEPARRWGSPTGRAPPSSTRRHTAAMSRCSSRSSSRWGTTARMRRWASATRAAGGAAGAGRGPAPPPAARWPGRCGRSPPPTGP